MSNVKIVDHNARTNEELVAKLQRAKVFIIDSAMIRAHGVRASNAPDEAKVEVIVATDKRVSEALLAIDQVQKMLQDGSAMVKPTPIPERLWPLAPEHDVIRMAGGAESGRVRGDLPAGQDHLPHA